MPRDDFDDYGMDEYEERVDGKRKSSRRPKSSKSTRRGADRVRSNAKSRERRNGRTHKGRNARPASQARKERKKVEKIFDVDVESTSSYRKFRKSVDDSIDAMAEESRKALKDSVKYFNDTYEDSVTTSLKIFDQFNKAQNKRTKKALASQLKLISENINEQLDLLEEQFEMTSDYLTDMDKEAHKVFYDNRSDDLKKLTKITTKYMDDVSETIDDSMGSGFVDKVKNALDSITSLDFANALNLGSIADSLKDDVQSLVTTANDISVNSGMDPELVKRIVQQGVAYSSSDLRNKLNQGDILEVVNQMSELGFNTQELYDQYLTPMLDAIVANGASFDQMANMLEIDADKGLNGQLVTEMSSGINTLIQKGGFNTTSQALTDDMNNIVSSIADLRDSSGNPITNDQFVDAMNNQLAGITMLENATFGTDRGNLTEAYTGLLNEIASTTDLNSDFAAAFSMLGASITDQRTGQSYAVNLQNIRNWMMSDDQYLQSLVPQAIINAMQAQALSGRGGSQSIYALADIPQLELDESATAALLEQFGSQDQVQKQADAYNKAMELLGGDTQQQMNDYLQNDLPVTIGEQVANGLSNWWNSSPVGSFFTDLFGSLGITITDAVTILAMGKNFLFGSEGGLGTWLTGKLFGKSGAGAAGDAVEEAATSGGLFSKLFGGGKNLLSKLGDKITGVPVEGESWMFQNPLAGGEFTEATSFGGRLLAKFPKLASGLTKVSSFASKALPFAGGALAAVQGVMEGVGGANLSNEWLGSDSAQDKVSSFFGGVLGGTGNGLKSGDLLENAGELGSGALKGAGIGAMIGSIIPGAGTAIGAGIGAGVGAIGSAIGGDTIAQWFSPVVNGISDGAQNLWNGAISTASGAWDWIKQTGSDIWTGITDTGTSIWNWAQDTGQAIADTPLVKGITNIGKGIWDWGSSTSKAIGDEFGNFWNNVIVPDAKYFGDQLSGGAKQVGDFAKGVWDKGVNFWNTTIAPGFQSIASGAQQLASDIWNNGIVPALNWIAEGLRPIGDAIQSALNWINQQVSNYIQDYNNLSENERAKMAGASSAGGSYSGNANYNTGSFDQVKNQNRKNYQQSATGLISGIASGSLSTESLMKDQLSGNTNKSTYFRPTGYAEGLSNVPSDNYAALLHEGEAVLTKEQADAVRPDGGLDVESAMTNMIAKANQAVMNNFVYSNSSNSNNMSLYDVVSKISTDFENYASRALNSFSQQASSLNKIQYSNSTSYGTAVANNRVTVSKLTTPSTVAANTENATSASNAAQNDLFGTKDLQNSHIHSADSSNSKKPWMESRTNQLAQYALGTSWVPDDQVAILHKGEMVVPADVNPYNRPEVANYSDNSDVVDAIRWLGAIVTSKIDEVENKIDNNYPAPSAPVAPYKTPSMTDIAFSF